MAVVNKTSQPIGRRMHLKVVPLLAYFIGQFPPDHRLVFTPGQKANNIPIDLSLGLPDETSNR